MTLIDWVRKVLGIAPPNDEVKAAVTNQIMAEETKLGDARDALSHEVERVQKHRKRNEDVMEILDGALSALNKRRQGKAQ